MDDATTEGAGQDGHDTATQEETCPGSNEVVFTPFEQPSALHDDLYLMEARRVSTRFLKAHKYLLVSTIATVTLAVAFALTFFFAPSPLVSALLTALVVYGAVQMAVEAQRVHLAGEWLASLRNACGYPPIPHGVSFRDHAQGLLSGRYAGGELEHALLTLWQGAGEDAEEQARHVLRHYNLPDLSAPDSPFQRAAHSPFPLWHRHSGWWSDAPTPSLEHTCSPWTMGVAYPNTHIEHAMFRCTCGAGSLDNIDWVRRSGMAAVVETSTKPSAADSSAHLRRAD